MTAPPSPSPVPAAAPRLALPGVTLCAATSVNLGPTIAALEACLAQVEPARTILFCDRDPGPRDPRIEWITCPPLTSSEAYSHFILKGVAPHLATDHLMIAQWDAMITDVAAWDPAFLTYDYIGAPWPQFGDGHDVGNGGFSIRSRRLVEALAGPAFGLAHPEDVAIGRTWRDALERDHAIRFAPAALAHRFSIERSGRLGTTFGFHGAFNLIPLLGADRFWTLYRGLDAPGPVFDDLPLILWQLGAGRGAMRRRLLLLRDAWTRRRGHRRLRPAPRAATATA